MSYLCKLICKTSQYNIRRAAAARLHGNNLLVTGEQWYSEGGSGGMASPE
jgi:hypothetical protein